MSQEYFFFPSAMEDVGQKCREPCVVKQHYHEEAWVEILCGLADAVFSAILVLKTQKTIYLKEKEKQSATGDIKVTTADNETAK